MKRILTLAALAAICCATSVHAADPAITCESSKLKLSGKYASCLLSADAKAVKTNTMPDYSTCVAKFGDKWETTETKAAGECPSNGDEAAVAAAITTCMSDVAASLSPPPACTGVALGGACWFLSPIGDDCDTTCVALGLNYDEATRTYAGSDGTNANCEAVMDALGADGAGAPFDNNACDNGYGCVTEFDDRHRCTDPVTSSAAASGAIFRMCACAP